MVGGSFAERMKVLISLRYSVVLLLILSFSFSSLKLQEFSDSLHDKIEFSGLEKPCDFGDEEKDFEDGKKENDLYLFESGTNLNLKTNPSQNLFTSNLYYEVHLSQPTPPPDLI